MEVGLRSIPDRASSARFAGGTCGWDGFLTTPPWWGMLFFVLKVLVCLARFSWLVYNVCSVCGSVRSLYRGTAWYSKKKTANQYQEIPGPSVYAIPSKGR